MDIISRLGTSDEIYKNRIRINTYSNHLWLHSRYPDRGKGDVLSESGTRNGYLETPDCTETVVGAFQETFTAYPRDGYKFEGWDYCQHQTGNVCRFDVDAATVQKARNHQLPAVVARFAPVDAPLGLVTEVLTARVSTCNLTLQREQMERNNARTRELLLVIEQQSEKQNEHSDSWNTIAAGLNNSLYSKG